MLGYFKNEELTDEVLRVHSDGHVWIHTGDLGHIDEDGFLFIDGRIKEMITRYDGFKVYPSLIEKVINTCEGIADCKVVGVDDVVNNQGQVPKAFVVLKPFADSSTVQKTILKKCKQVLPEYYVENFEVDVMEKLPLTDLGKVDFKKLAEDENAKRHSNNKGLRKIFK